MQLVWKNNKKQKFIIIYEQVFFFLYFVWVMLHAFPFQFLCFFFPKKKKMVRMVYGPPKPRAFQSYCACICASTMYFLVDSVKKKIKIKIKKKGIILDVMLLFFMKRSPLPPLYPPSSLFQKVFPLFFSCFPS